MLSVILLTNSFNIYTFKCFILLFVGALFMLNYYGHFDLFLFLIIYLSLICSGYLIYFYDTKFVKETTLVALVISFLSTSINKPTHQEIAIGISFGGYIRHLAS